MYFKREEYIIGALPSLTHIHQRLTMPILEAARQVLEEPRPAQQGLAGSALAARQPAQPHPRGGSACKDRGLHSMLVEEGIAKATFKRAATVAKAADSDNLRVVRQTFGDWIDSAPAKDSPGGMLTPHAN